MAIRDLMLGRIALPTILDDVKESVGDKFDVTGASVTPGEPQARPFTFSVPIHGDPADGTALYTNGDKLRRQVRSLIDNPIAGRQPIYLDFGADPELNGWLLIGGGDLEYVDGGVSLSEYKLTLTDCYKVASRRTHYQGVFISNKDLRTGLYPRDFLRTVASTDFSAATRLNEVVGQLGLSKFFTSYGVPVPTTAVTLSTGPAESTTTAAFNIGGLTAHGDSQVMAGDDLVSAEDYAGLNDVVILDRRGNTTAVRNTATVVNEVTNPSLEVSAAGYSNGGVVPSVFARAVANPFSGTASLHLTTAPSGGNYTEVVTPIASTGKYVTAGQTYSFQQRVFVATANSNAIQTFLDWVDVSGAFLSTSQVNFTNNVTGARVLTSTAVAPANAARVGLRTRWFGAGTLDVYIDGSQFSQGSAPAYFDGSFPGCSWEGAPHLSRSVQGAAHFNEAAYGWEEVYGPNYPLTTTDMPVVQNGRCRVRWDTTVPSLVVDSWMASAGDYVEVARITFPGDTGTGGSAANLGHTELPGPSARVVNWTPFMATVKVSLFVTADPSERANVYVTLRRDANFPRIDMYRRGDSSRVAAMFVAPNSTTTLTFGRNSGAATVSGTVPNSTFTAETEPGWYLSSATKEILGAVVAKSTTVFGRTATLTSGYNDTRFGVHFAASAVDALGNSYLGLYVGGAAGTDRSAGAASGIYLAEGRKTLDDLSLSPTLISR